MQLDLTSTSRPDTLLTIPPLVLNNNDQNGIIQTTDSPVMDDEAFDDSSILKFDHDYKQKNPCKRSKNDANEVLSHTTHSLWKIGTNEIDGWFNLAWLLLYTFNIFDIFYNLFSFIIKIFN